MRSSATSSARPSVSETKPDKTFRRRPQLSEEVATHLRGQVMTAALRPGDHVRLDETAQRLGVSVTPVREALLTLRGLSLIHISEPTRPY